MIEKYILGLEVGITAVGWAIIGETSNDIIDAGVRMFPSADATTNQTRKIYRGSRRNTRRLQNRLKRLDLFLESYEIFKPIDLEIEPLDLRIKGLTNKLNRTELYVVLYNLTKHRGVSFLEDDKELGKESTIHTISDKFEYPCHQQKERLEKYGAYRGRNSINGKTFINTFTTDMFEQEAIAILENQKQHHSFINQDFISGFITIFKSKREYYTGPGNPLSRTNYGIFKTDGKTLEYLYDEFRGTCSIYNGKQGVKRELRASSASYSAQYYNVLNDLCNVRVDGKKLTMNQKIEIIETLKSYKLAITFRRVIKRLYNIEPERISGYRVNKKNKDENHSFEIYRAMRKYLSKKGVDIEQYDTKKIDAIADILTLNPDTSGCLKHFMNENREEYKYVKDLEEKEIQAFIELKQDRKDLFRRWSSFSYSALEVICPEMLVSGEEQYACIKKLGLKKEKTTTNINIDYRPIIDEIYNPSVSRSIIQSIKIVNHIIKTYDITSIILEMPKDNSLIEEKNNLSKMQAKNKNLKMMALSYAGITESEIDARKDKRIIQKLKLYYMQKGRCLYSGRKININKLLEGTIDYEIDHIIPMSVSFDDSISNKVLVEADQNRRKSNMTPYHYLNQTVNTWTYKEYRTYVLGLRRERLISDAKKENLLMEEDIKKADVIKGYINRNTNDTRYASKVVYNELDRFFKAKNRRIEVKVINSAITNQLRNATFEYNKNWRLEYNSYARNAMICCYAGLSLNHYYDQFINVSTGEILDKQALEKLDTQEQVGYLLLSGWDIKHKF